MANSCIGRERDFEHFANTHGTRSVILRLSYALDMRDGFLHDIAQAVLSGTPVPLGMGHCNVIWQGSVNDVALRALALAAERGLDERRQRALSRYYLDAGSIGLAVGVHTTQFPIREAGLYAPVLEIAAEEALAHISQPLLVAGAMGPTEQAVAEAETTRAHGYHAVLLSLAGRADLDEDALIAHCRAVVEVMPLFGFYLQPAVGGHYLPKSFWRRFAEIENVLGIKIAPFNRYYTLDVVRGVVAARARIGSHPTQAMMITSLRTF